MRQSTGTQPPQNTDMKLIAQRLKYLEREVDRLRNLRGPTLPQYDPDNFPAQSVQGQIAIAHPSSSQPETAWAYDSVNGWWKIGTSAPGVGDWVEAESVGSGTRQIILNNAQTVIVFNNTVSGRAGGAGTVTIDVDEMTFKGTIGGQIDISGFFILTGDDVGNRGIYLVDTVNNLDDSEQVGDTFPVGNTSAGFGAQGTFKWRATFDNNWSFSIAAYVGSATGDQALNFAQCSVSLVAPLGS